MRVLVACEFSGIVREAFRAKGHDAWSCDLLPAEDGSPFHLVRDARWLLCPTSWDLLIGHPPCQFMANSGVRWLTTKAGRWDDLRHATEFFLALWNAPIPCIALENPVMHKYAKEQIGVRQTQVIQPWMFGHGETKATCLWLKGLPLLRPTNIVEGRAARVHREPPGPDRWKNRSRTLPGMAAAMAEQWGK